MERKKLISLAKELNKVLDLEPVIPTQPNVKEATLVEKITTAAGLIDLENDTFSEEAIEAMQELGVWPGDGKAPEDDKNATVELEPEPVKEKAKDKGKEKSAAETAKEKPVKPAKEAPIKKGMSRVDAICTIIKNLKKPITKQELNEKSDSLYVKNGGKSNLRENMYVVVRVLPTLNFFEIETNVE